MMLGKLNETLKTMGQGLFHPLSSSTFPILIGLSVAFSVVDSISSNGYPQFLITNVWNHMYFKTISLSEMEHGKQSISYVNCSKDY